MCGGIEKSLNALGENFGLGVGFGIGENGMPFFGIKSEVVVSGIPKIKTVFEYSLIGFILYYLFHYIPLYFIIVFSQYDILIFQCYYFFHIMINDF